MKYDVIILGAGAAGMMCAAVAASRGRRTLVLDHGPAPGRKILISGGGRANFTNLGARADNFLGANPDFARSALAGFTPQDMVALVERHGIRYHEKKLGQLFCDGSARELVTLLEKEMAAAGAELRCNVRIDSVRAAPTGFALETSQGPLEARSVVIATGGLSIPKLGATGFGYEVARSFGHSILEPRPALVPFVFAPEDQHAWCDLTGTATETVARTDAPAQRSRRHKQPEFRERLLITHRGLSGPAILQISSYWKPGSAVTLDLAPGLDVFAPLLASTARDPRMLAECLRPILPARLAERWLALREDKLSLRNAGIEALERELHHWTVTPAGTEGFAKAEVTAGGVNTDELHAGTLESKRTPGLFFVGEVVDITGWLGGYNFQWAWASAVAAGRAA